MQKSLHKGEYKGGAILSYITLVANCLYGIFFTPYIIRTIGEAEYGLYQLIGAYAGYLSILDLGMASSVTKYVARFYRRGEKEKENGFLGLIFFVYLILSIITICAGVCFYFKIDNIFRSSLSSSELFKAKRMFILLCVNLVISLFGGIFRGVMYAYECFIQSKGAELYRTVIKVVMVWMIITRGGDSIALVIIDSIVNFALLTYRIIFCFIKIKIRFSFFKFDSSEIRDFVFFAIFVFLDMVFDQLNWKVDNLIIGMKLSTVAVTIYAIGSNFSNYFMNFSIAIKSLFLPKIMYMESQGATNEDYTDFLIKTGRIQGFLLLYIYFAFILMGRQFIEIIMKKPYPEAWLAAVFVMSGLLFPLLQNGGHPILQAKNKHHVYVLVNLFVSIGNVIGTWIVIERYGILGAAFMTMLTFVFGQAVFLGWYYYKVIGIKIGVFYLEIIRGNIIPSIFPVVIEYAVIKVFPISNWLTFLINAAAFSFLYFASVFCFGMNSEEKDILLKIRKVKR